MFKGDINSFRRYEAINLIVIVEILVFFALIVFSRTFAIASVIIAITSIIWVLLKIRPDENTLIFDNSDFVHINKHTKTRYGYDSIAKVTFSNPPRHQKSITIVLTDNSKFTFQPDATASLQAFRQFIESKKNEQTNTQE